ncbi:2-phospho-L-lactate guanylyltransferase [Isoptericola variabilis]|uniref:Phosphoenolpyruvate guanylyltransferase n=1 Tax=Isoptericola variabilis (strain 225) TaxID=743718 RepID=F6FU04_ISOV2|nr:2-phospho-L-lactate guanylyltransferase [Isoptericola variabilis]AEG45375.1 2-phospho-L-lactate guanylyltransferase CofC [Isoptericola variabilis 225]TWH30281.1 2-phospho-L-lactate guanylyltransferase [Isoptericola variabilis J7]
MSARGGAVAVVPLRDGVSGKSRLAGELDPPARRRLVAALARHVVEVLAAMPAVERIVVVTADLGFVHETLAGLLGPAGRVTVVEQPAQRPGLNAAVAVGREHASGLGAERLLVVHADLPALAPDDVEAVLRADADVVVATDRHASGTNLLLVPLHPPGSSFTFRFGPDSRAAHVAEAGRLGLRAVVVHRPGTAADLDTIDDWTELPPAVRARVRTAVGHRLP